MRFIGDFHVHSKFSRATAKNLDLENLYISAQKKGITVVGTGDFTHPEWFEEIRNKLVPAEQGLFRLKPDIAKACDKLVPSVCRNDVRFILTTEISNIYKKNGKTRKVHNLIFFPDLKAVSDFSAKLSAIGNIASDGRPILGLDSRDLLEIMLDTSEHGFFIPAHIWTPWFSVLGSKSGFDSIRECFEDLTSYITAVETGLSSDPAMNWRISSLDNLTLVSNSDAHSPANLGREANLFNTGLDYFSIIDAMKTGDPEKFIGTLEFYPQEGKYHYDGHRKCGICFNPEQTCLNNGICPVCGKPLTLGVLYRINALSDRCEGIKPKYSNTYISIVPLVDILSEIFRVGPKSKKVEEAYHLVISKGGPELNVLYQIPPEALDNINVPLLKVAVERMRENKVFIHPGYDGEYGKVKIFKDGEREILTAQKSLFVFSQDDIFVQKENRVTRKTDEPEIFLPKTSPAKPMKKHTGKDSENRKTECLNEEQRHAVYHLGRVLLIVAGPGTGKTRTLTYKIVHLIREKQVIPEKILAVTFTNKAASEMKDRLTRLLGNNVKQLPFVGTFHSVCIHMLQKLPEYEGFSVLNDEDRIFYVQEAINGLLSEGIHIKEKPPVILDKIVAAKQNIEFPAQFTGDVIKTVFDVYQKRLASEKLWDFEDLITNVVKRFESDPAFLKTYQDQFQYIFVDEYQDLNKAQYRFIKAMVPGETKNLLADESSKLCVIGDPDQAIYGFRGSDIMYFQQLLNDYPDAEIIRLKRNYRSSQTILKASCQVIEKSRSEFSSEQLYSTIKSISTVRIIETISEKAEAETIARQVEKLMGGADFYSIDSGRIQVSNEHRDKGFSDFAVLFRTRKQGEVLADAFRRRGIPYQLVAKKHVFSTKSVVEVISMLRIVENMATLPDRKKLVTFTMADIELMKEKCKDAVTVRKKLEILVDHYISRSLENTNDSPQKALNKILDFSMEFGQNICKFLSMAALQTDPDVYIPKAERVALMTMHAAKGLEFPVVFIAGCEDELIPYKHDAGICQDIDEERRLFYVAMTRAMEYLFLTWSHRRQRYGKIVNRKLSPFVGQIEQCLKFYEKMNVKNKTQNSQVQLQMF